MKLKLKQALNYLPHNVLIQRVYKGNLSDTQYSDTVPLTISDIEYYFGDNCSEFNSIRLVLKPITDLTTEFIKENNILDSMPCDYYLGFDIEIDESGTVGLRTPESWLPVTNWIPLYEELFKHHIDVYGLIDDGLAIDINTL
jgi:hypothetical protein